MKHAFYISLMMILFTLVSFMVYLCSIYSLVFYKIVDRYHVIQFTDMTMSSPAYIIVALIGIALGYIFGKKWWKIIYIDKVYHFDK